MNSIIPNNETHDNKLQPIIFEFLKELKVREMLFQSNCHKEKGMHVLEVFKTLFSLVFTGKIFLRFLQTDLEVGAKDVKRQIVTKHSIKFTAN